VCLSLMCLPLWQKFIFDAGWSIKAEFFCRCDDVTLFSFSSAPAVKLFCHSTVTHTEKRRKGHGTLGSRNSPISAGPSQRANIIYSRQAWHNCAPDKIYKASAVLKEARRYIKSTFYCCSHTIFMDVKINLFMKAGEY